jgi:hypothetical protein
MKRIEQKRSSIQVRRGSMASLTVSLVFVFCIGMVAIQVDAQNGASPSAEAPPKPVAPTPPAASPSAQALYSGCVQQSPGDKDTLVLSTDTVCAKLTGDLATASLAGHEIDLKGVLTPRAARTPASIQIDSISHVGKSCSDVCSLRPPGTRGLGGEKPGREGGRPGVTPTTPPAPPQ